MVMKSKLPEKKKQRESTGRKIIEFEIKKEMKERIKKEKVRKKKSKRDILVEQVLSSGQVVRNIQNLYVHVAIECCFLEV